MHAPTILTLLLATLPFSAPNRENPPEEERVDPRPILIRSTYPEQLTVRAILPPGTRVEIGQVVIEFFAAPFRDRLAKQHIITEQAQAELEDAENALEIAQLELQDYEEGIFPQQLKEREAEIKLAEADLARARARMNWGDRMVKQNYISYAEHLSIRYDLQRAEFNLQQAEEKKKVLIEYTREKELKALRRAIEAAQAEVQAKQSLLADSQAKAEEFRRILDEGDHVLAPANGVVQYDEERISPYAVVREGQLLFRFQPDEPITVHEAHKAALPRDTKAP